MHRPDALLRIRTNLCDQPETIGISASLCIDPDTVVGRLVRFWGWVKDVSDGGFIPFLTVDRVDEVARQPGLGAALREVGWLIAEEGGLRVPDFEAYLADPPEGSEHPASRLIAGILCKNGEWHEVWQNKLELYEQAWPGIDIRAEIMKAKHWCEHIATECRRPTKGRFATFIKNWFERAKGSPSAPGKQTPSPAPAKPTPQELLQRVKDEQSKRFGR